MFQVQLKYIDNPENIGSVQTVAAFFPGEEPAPFLC
jgi:hypothetical protein